MPLEIYRDRNGVTIRDPALRRTAVIYEGVGSVAIDGDLDLAQRFLGTRRGLLDLEADYTTHHNGIGYPTVQTAY